MHLVSVSHIMVWVRNVQKMCRHFVIADTFEFEILDFTT